jgi:hypothetical protein
MYKDSPECSVGMASDRLGKSPACEKVPGEQRALGALQKFSIADDGKHRKTRNEVREVDKDQHHKSPHRPLKEGLERSPELQRGRSCTVRSQPGFTLFDPVSIRCRVSHTPKYSCLHKFCDQFKA